MCMRCACGLSSCGTVSAAPVFAASNATLKPMTCAAHKSCTVFMYSFYTLSLEVWGTQCRVQANGCLLRVGA